MNERIFSESIKKFPFTQKKLFRPAVFSQGIVTTSHSAPHGTRWQLVNGRFEN